MCFRGLTRSIPSRVTVHVTLKCSKVVSIPFSGNIPLTKKRRTSLKSAIFYLTFFFTSSSGGNEEHLLLQQSPGQTTVIVYFSFFFKGFGLLPCHRVTAPPLRLDSSLSAACDAQQIAVLAPLADEALERIPGPRSSCVTATERSAADERRRHHRAGGTRISDPTASTFCVTRHSRGMMNDCF